MYRLACSLGLMGCLLLFGSGPVIADERDERIQSLETRLRQMEEMLGKIAKQNDALFQKLASPPSQEVEGETSSSSAQLPEISPGKIEPAKKEAVKKEDKKTDPPKEYVVGKQIEAKAQFKNGLQFESADKAFKTYVGGRVHNDWGWWTANNDIQVGRGGVGPLEDGANFRRARVRMGGTLFEVVDFFSEYGFETKTPQFFDMFGEITNTPLGNLRIGHFREPFSMDALTSGNSLMLMERSFIQDAFVPFRNTGVMWYKPFFEEASTVAVGLFRANSDNFNGADVGDGKYALTSRVTVNPWYKDEGRYAFHLGVAGSIRQLPNLDAAGNPVAANAGSPRVRFQTRPEERISAANFANTGFISADEVDLLGLEAGLGLGRFNFQAEYVGAWTQDALLPNQTRGALFYQGWYAQASVFLTGENRPYLRKQGVFGQLMPHENFWFVKDDGGRWNCGRGAWELAVRYSQVDLDNRGINGGHLQDVTLGLNWYLNPNVRFMCNYIHIIRDAPGTTSDGTAEFLGMRMQVDF